MGGVSRAVILQISTAVFRALSEKNWGKGGSAP